MREQRMQIEEGVAGLGQVLVGPSQLQAVVGERVISVVSID